MPKFLNQVQVPSTPSASDHAASKAYVDAGLAGKAAASHDHTNISGNAYSATRLSSVRTFQLTGDVTGSVSSDLVVGLNIATTVTPPLVEWFTATANQTSFTLSQTPRAIVAVFADRLLARPQSGAYRSRYTVSGKTVTFGAGLEADTDVCVIYYK